MESVRGDSPLVRFEHLSPRNLFYKETSEHLSEDEVKSLRAMLVTDNHINKGKIQTATPHEIFNMLEDDGKIGEGNLGLLKEVLKGLGQEQLAKKAEDLEEEELMKLASNKRKATEDASSAKQKRMSCHSEGADDSDSSAESGIGCPSSSSQSMEMDEFENGGDFARSADGSTLETVGDVRKRIEHLRIKIADLTRNPNNISKTKNKELLNTFKEMERLVKLLEEQGTGELHFDIALLNTKIQDEFQEICETGRPYQEIGKEVKQIMQSTSDDIVNVKPEVKVESANFSPGQRATIKVTAEDVELADSCKLDKDSAVRHLFRYLVDNSQELRPITRYLNSFDVQVTSISYGSIDFECLCLTSESAVRLQQEYDGKNLQAQFQRVISSLAILTDFGIRSISLAVDHKFADTVSAGVTANNEAVIGSIGLQLAEMKVNPLRKSRQFVFKPTSAGKTSMAMLRFSYQVTEEAPTKQVQYQGEIPKLCAEIMKCLPKWAEEKSPLLRWSEYKEAVMQMIPGPGVDHLANEDFLKTSLQYLAHLGEILFVSTIAEPIVVLAPNWLCTDVFGKVMAPENFPIQHLRTADDIVTKEEIQNVFQDVADVDLLITLLQEFQLCHTYDEQEFIIPGLLTQTMPPSKWQPTANPAKTVYFGKQVQCADTTDMFSSAFFPRVQTRLMRELKNRPLLWRDGAKCFDSNVESLIKLSPDGRAVNICVRSEQGDKPSCLQMLETIENILIMNMLDECSPGTTIEERVLSARALKEHREEFYSYSMNEITQAKAEDGIVHHDLLGFSEEVDDLLCSGRDGTEEEQGAVGYCHQVYIPGSHNIIIDTGYGSVVSMYHGAAGQLQLEDNVSDSSDEGLALE